MCHPFTNSRYHSTWFMSKDHGCCEDKISNSSLLPVMHIWTTDPNCMHLNLHLYSLSKKSISKFLTCNLNLHLYSLSEKSISKFLTCNLRKKINFKHWSIIWKRSNFRIPRNSFTCHWIRIASIVLCLDLQSFPTHVSEADQSCGVFWNLALKNVF